MAKRCSSSRKPVEGAWVELPSAKRAATVLAMLVVTVWALGGRGAAQDNATFAESQAEEARSCGMALADLKARMDGLWPAHPENIEAMELWLEEARGLVKRLPAHQRALADLCSRGRPFPHTRDRDLAELKVEAAALAKGLASTEDQEARQAAEAALHAKESHISILGAWIECERQYEFADAADASRQNALASMVYDLMRFRTDDQYRDRIRSMEERLEFARTIRQRSIHDQQVAWNQAIASIASEDECPQYNGLQLKPQLGLVPIGPDADSGLWEFWHVQTGERPERNEKGRLVPTEDMGLVFVLIPAGTFWMGAQANDPEGRNYDPQTEHNESNDHGEPVEVALDAFFLSKYEMTQGQWRRFTGTNPSRFDPGRYARSWSRDGSGGDLRHPVEQVIWQDCTDVLGRLGLVLPTEAQWEYACRASTDTPWWTGRDVLGLDQAGNLADAYANEHGAGSWRCHEELDDGFTGHAPVGSYRPNGFGLHDVVGNVWEWCRDSYGPYDLPVAAGDGERQVTKFTNRTVRGGSFTSPASPARSAARSDGLAGIYLSTVGCRPVRRPAG